MEQPERTDIARETDRIHQVTASDARRRALVAGCIGNLVEWYDFAIYGAFATFVARPAGALLFAHYGDRLGR
jgi:hypothetical protein